MTIETANRFYELRKKHNFSQEELAEKLGVSRQAVSKWERSEASPDTDNLIALAKIYGLSLDELVYGEKEEVKEEVKKESEAETNESENVEDVYINIDDEGEKVKIGPDGILVEKKDGQTVKISVKGKIFEKIIDKIEDNLDEDEFDIEDNDNETVWTKKDGHLTIEVKKQKNPSRFWLDFPYTLICAILYLICGCYGFHGGWGHAWVIFVTIPVYDSLIEAIYKRRFNEFEYAVLAAFVFLVWGMYDIVDWHPGWLIFLTVPVYSCIASALDRMIQNRKK